MYILSADYAVRITEIRALLKFALETHKQTLVVQTPCHKWGWHDKRRNPPGTRKWNETLLGMVRVIGAVFLVWKWIGFGLAWVFDQHCTASWSGHVPPGFTFVQPLKAHLCPDKQIFMITTREGAVRTLFFQTRHTEKCYQIAQLRS